MPTQSFLMQMQTPFRYQVTRDDCAPTSVINALTKIVGRSKFPAAVLYHIYRFTLDGVGREGKLGDGTTTDALEVLGFWLRSYRTKRFRVVTDHVRGRAVVFSPRSYIRGCFREGGVAVTSVHLSPTQHHVLLLTDMSSRAVEGWDPLFRVNPTSKTDGVEFLPSDGLTPNIRIDLNRLNSPRKQGYSLGPTTGRSTLLLWRD
jgi:hypothetical protein